MNLSSAPAEIGRLVAPILQRYEQIAAAYLMGSAVSGRLRADSDIDIALLLFEGQPIAVQERLKLAADLQQQVKRPVDLGVITSGNLVYAYEAMMRGQRFFTANRDVADATETRLLGCYFQLRHDRREVETAYHAA